MKTNRVDISREDLIGESLLLSLLGRVLYQYPDGEQRAWFQSLIDSDAFMEAPFAEDHQDVITGLEFLQAWRKRGLTDETFLDLQEDYSRLFIGPGKVIAPPWESVFFNESRQTFQEQTLQVRSWYRRYGVEPEKLFREPDDHIGLEINFLVHLLGLANQALDKKDQSEFDTLIDARRLFLSEHPLKWAFSWCSLVIEHARTDFYKGMAYLTRGALLAIAQNYALIVPAEAVH